MSFNSKIYIIQLNGKTSRKQIRKYVCVYSSPYYIQITLYSYVFLWYTLFPGFKVCNVRPLLTLLTSYTLLTIGHKLPYLKKQGKFLWLETIFFSEMRSCIISTQLLYEKPCSLNGTLI